MKNKIFQTFIILIFLNTGNIAFGQCSGGANGGAIIPTAVFQTVAVTGGNYYTFSGVAGNNYIFTFCQGGGSAGFDTQLTMLNNAGGYAGGYSDDNCGVQSELIWNCPSNATYRVLFNTYFCSAGGAATMAYRIVPSAGPGANCSNPYIIAALPFTANGLTTCGFFNDYDATVPCNSIYMGGEDFVFRYVATGPVALNITLTGTLTFTGVFVVQGCPNAGGTCVAPSGTIVGCTAGSGTNESFTGNPFGTFCLPGAGTYYILVDTWPSPTCTPFNINITSAACASGGSACYTITTPAYSNDNYNTGTSVVFPDDEFSPVIPIPFSFCFMGNTFNSLVISSNGYVTFNTVCAGGYSEYDTDPVPTTAIAGVQNSIMAPWQDIDPTVSGTIKYTSYGISPNQRFVISFRNVGYFDAFLCPGLQYTGQITLYETTNIVRTNILQKPVCVAWNNGDAVHALTDPTGTAAIVVPGRNNTNFTINNESTVFTPCSGCILPSTTWASFTGQEEGQVNRLNWATQFEINSSLFVLEHSRTGNSWEPVEQINAIGTAPEGNNYEAIDAHPYPLLTYYRLRLVDENGSETTSETIAVSRNNSGLLIQSILQPSESSLIEISMLSSSNGKKVTLSLTDAMGRTILAQNHLTQEGLNVWNLDVNNISTGLYFLTANDGTNYRETRSIIIH